MAYATKVAANVPNGISLEQYLISGDPTKRPNYDLWLMKYEEKDGKIVPGPITRITDNASATPMHITEAYFAFQTRI